MSDPVLEIAPGIAALPPPEERGAGQVVLQLDEQIAAPAEQIRDLYKLSDPQLSELGFDSLLDELLERVRDLLGVDTAAILLLDPEKGQLVARAAKGIEEEVERGVRLPIGRGFAGRIAKERVAIFIADVDHADILNPILRQRGIRSLLGVPLIVEGDLIGVLHVGALQPRVFDQRDLAVLQLAAARAAPAIERARLMNALAHEHRIAAVLQRSLLPRRLSEVTGVSIAARYLPARDEVGGDWYDVIDLSRGRVGIAIGDVVGHGLAAATLMGQLRTALHAYAVEGHGPAHTLELVDRFTRSLQAGAMATAAYAVIDIDSGRLRVASAGHLPPLLISAAGTVRVPELPQAPPLGVFGYKSCPESELTLAEGETILLYTDGLIERPRIALDDSIAELADVVHGARTAEEACLVAMDRMLPMRGPRDDVAVIALQSTAIPDVLELELPAVPGMLAEVRRMLTRWLRSKQIEREVAAEITIAVSEACANAIEHAYGPAGGSFAVQAQRVGDVAEVVVRDAGRWRPPRGENRGRGLKIMQAAMDELEVGRDGEGTRVVMRRKVTA
jgi:anti-sigma regulatory factor (Ser/Thr protein kinase)/putative methionine-R-sulfoxide reductase with GAF domain